MKDSHSSKHMFQDYILDLFLCVMLSLRPVAFFLSSSARVWHLMSPVVICMISVAWSCWPVPEVGIGQAVPRSASSYWPGGGASLIKWPALGGGHQTSSDPTTSEPPPLFHQVLCLLSGAFRCFALCGGHQTSSYPTTSEPPPLFHQVHSVLPSLFGGLEVGSSFANNMIIFGTEKESFIQKTVRLYCLWCLWPSEKQWPNFTFKTLIIIFGD